LSRTSTIARHEKRGEIEAAIVRGDPVRKIAEKYGLDPMSVQKYKPKLADRIQKYTTEQNEKPVDYLSELSGLRVKAIKMLDDAMATNDKRLALLAMREAKELLVTEGKWTGQYKDSPGVQVNIQQNVIDAIPEVWEVICPECKTRAIAVLRAEWEKG
jgi:hypothetical protein